MTRRINIVKVALVFVAGLENRGVDRAAKMIRVSSQTLYKWVRAGHLRGARGADVLRVYELTGISLELLLGVDGQPAVASRVVRGNKGQD